MSPPPRHVPASTGRFEGESEAHGQYTNKPIEARQPRAAATLPPSVPFEGESQLTQHEEATLASHSSFKLMMILTVMPSLLAARVCIHGILAECTPHKNQGTRTLNVWLACATASTVSSVYYRSLPTSTGCGRILFSLSLPNAFTPPWLHLTQPASA